MQILYYGSLVEAMEPQELRAVVADEAFRLYDVYIDEDK